jgi:hypothetical protein
LHRAGGAGDGLAPLVHAAQVLGAAVVGLQAREAQHGLGGDRLRQRHGGLAGRHAAAALAHVDFDEDVDQGLRGAGRALSTAAASRAMPSRLSTAIASRPPAACRRCASAATRCNLAGR